LLLSWVLGVAAFSSRGEAEDWNTTDGRHFEDVSVVKVEDDAVTILSKDGGARLPLSVLPADLQARFNFDPVKAAAAAAKREMEEQASLLEEDEATKLAETTAPGTPTDPAHKRVQVVGQMIDHLPEGYVVKLRRADYLDSPLATALNWADPQIVPDGTYLLRSPEPLSADRMVNVFATSTGRKMPYHAADGTIEQIEIFNADAIPK
jgi:hypothetical protein